MDKLGAIDPLQSGRAMASAAQRRSHQQQRLEAARVNGYAWLLELCRLGESDRAQQLARAHPEWGYEIVGDTVQECLESADEERA